MENGQDGELFETFTDQARNAVSVAQEEAQRFNQNYIGTEHLLLGLIRERNGVAARLLIAMGVDLKRVCRQVETIISRRDHLVVPGNTHLTPRAITVLELAADEAHHLNHHYVGTEHILLGLLRESEGIAAGVLESLGASLSKARHTMLTTINQTDTPRDDSSRAG